MSSLVGFCLEKGFLIERDLVEPESDRRLLRPSPPTEDSNFSAETSKERNLLAGAGSVLALVELIAAAAVVFVIDFGDKLQEKSRNDSKI